MEEKIFQINFQRSFLLFFIENTIHIFTVQIFLMVNMSLVIFIQCRLVLFDKKLYPLGR